MKTLLVTVPGMISEVDLAPLRSVGSLQYEETDGLSEIELAAMCDGFDLLMLNYDAVKLLSPVFYDTKAVRELRAISTDITGMDWSSPEAAQDAGVPLLHIPHYSTQSVAESIVAEVLLHSRQRHLAYVDEIKERTVQARKGFNLNSRVAGVIGQGAIGICTAGILSALGMKVLVWNRSPKSSDHEPAHLEKIFAQADVICVCVKTVREGPGANVGMIGTELLSMSRGAVLVNLANNDLVDRDALANSIDSGNIAAYSVERSDELLKHRLGTMELVHLPPSNAWFSDESLARLRSTWVSNTLAAMEGTLVNVYSI